MATKKEQQAGPGSNLRAMMFLVVSAVALLALGVVVWSLMQTYQKAIEKASQKDETVAVIVASRDLYQGVVITEDDLYQLTIPAKYMKEHVRAQRAAYFEDPALVVGRVPRERILANEFIRDERLADSVQGIGLNATVERGMRAISINIGDGHALSGFLNPKDYVDVLVTVRPEDNKAPPETHTLLQGVVVLAVNDRTEEAQETEVDGRQRQLTRRPRKARPSVTLMVTPGQAEQVAHAERVGEITLALRNRTDFQVAEVGGTDTKTLLGEEEKPPTVRPVRTGPGTDKVEIIVGGKTKVEEYKKNQ